ncbi:very short patch repair endonuclease [Gordonia sp. SMJS1]|uniref:very short patch repair endonuclease n=1 Tax=Gordonia sp. SMJS1 TaxID=3039400 RepID=UPI002453BEC7|nr:very short patch repair endonuclease [Gordonia sp. SMJS1]WGJ83639.1 very short patch repair endonuclease [Gordonia sp. SMJS1]
MSDELDPPSDVVRRQMQRQRTTGTKVELSVRRALHARGYRYRVDLGGLVPGRRFRGDIVWTRAKVVVFLDGCFWHMCPEHCVVPKSNSVWWQNKLEGNRQRDDCATLLLEAQGWRVLRFWEHESPDDIVNRIENELQKS